MALTVEAAMVPLLRLATLDGNALSPVVWCSGLTHDAGCTSAARDSCDTSHVSRVITFVLCDRLVSLMHMMRLTRGSAPRLDR